MLSQLSWGSERGPSIALRSNTRHHNPHPDL